MTEHSCLLTVLAKEFYTQLLGAVDALKRIALSQGIRCQPQRSR